MTSLASNNISPAQTSSSSATPSTLSANTTTQATSGQSSTTAAATAASRATQSQVSYAAATKKASPPIVSSTSSPSGQLVSGAQGPNARTTNASPVNGKTQVAPAVPSVAGVSVVVNGTAGNPNGHSRKSSIVSGGNGGTAWNGISQVPRQQPSAGPIQFGSFGTQGQGSPAPLGNAQVSSTNLAAPPGPNPRVASPQMSPSPLPQPAVSGGPLTQGIGGQGNITFGSLQANVPDRVDQRQMHGSNRPTSMPIPPIAPASQGQSHIRRESAGHHPEMSQGMGPNRGGMHSQGGGRGRGPQYGNHQFNPQPQGYGNHNNYSRSGPNSRGSFHHPTLNNNYQNMQSQMGGFPSPQRPPRSPAMVHAVPHSQPGTPQMNSVPMAANSPSFQQASLYQTPPPHQQQFLPQAQQHYDPSMSNMYHPPFHSQQIYAQTYTSAPPPGSPRHQYIAPMGAPGPYAGYPIPQPMSRSASAAAADIHRPNSGFAPIPQPHTPMTPPANIAHPPSTPNMDIFKKPERQSKGIAIVHPDTGASLSFKPDNKPRPVVVSSAGPVIVSSSGPSPNPRAAEEKKKADEEKRRAMALQVQKKKEEDEAREREAKEAEQRKKEEEERLKREAEEAEEKRRKEEEEEKKRKAEEEERLRKEAEEKARLEEEERKRKEEEERIRQEEEERKRREEEERLRKEEEERKRKEEEERIAREKAEEEARIQKEKEEEEARIAKEKEEAERKAREEEEAKAKAEAEAAAAKAAEEAKAKAAAEEATKANTEKTVDPKTEETDTLAAAKAPPAEEGARPGKAKGKPVPLVLKTSNEPGPPSAALTALRSARFIGDINSVQYPSNIMSPNPALNQAAPSGKFKYHKDFLLQFQDVFKDKPSTDWDQRLREIVGDTIDSARPSTARLAPSSLGPRGSRGIGAGSSQTPMGLFGSSGAGSTKFGLPPNMMTSQQRFEQSTSGRPGLTTGNPLQSLVSQVGTLRSSAAPTISRTNSSTGLSQQGSSTPQSPRTGNRSRGSKRATGGAPMEKSESKRDVEPKPVLTIPPSEVKPLIVSETRWKPRSIQQAQATGAPPGVASLQTVPVPTEDNRLSPELVQRKVKAALNKMTPEKFEKISQQILDIASQSKYETDGRTLRQVIQLTFEKATDEAAWSSMYAKFCKVMMDCMDPEIRDEGIIDQKTGKVVTGGSLFRKYLLNRCQEEFQRGWKVNLPPKPEGVTDETAMLSEEYYIAAAAKRRGLGLIQFIGELFKLGMLTERIMHECVKKLVDFEGTPEEAEVESLSKLLRTIGSALDSTERSKPAMDAYFSRIVRMVELPDLPSRLKFMLMDVIDLRSRGWDSNEADKGPKTIAEIREDAIKAQQEKDAASRANAQRGGRPLGGRGGDGRSFSQGGYGGQSDYQRNSNTVDMGELRKLGQKSRTTSSNPGAFGPPSMFSRSGSNPGKRIGPTSSKGDDSGPTSRSATPAAGQQREPTPSKSVNAFQALASMGQADGEDATDSISPAPSAASSPPTNKATLATRSLA